MGETKQAGTEIAGSAVQPGTDVLGKRRQQLVQQIPSGSDEAAHHDGIPQPRRVPRTGTVVEYGGILARLQLPGRL